MIYLVSFLKESWPKKKEIMENQEKILMIKPMDWRKSVNVNYDFKLNFNWTKTCTHKCYYPIQSNPYKRAAQVKWLKLFHFLLRESSRAKIYLCACWNI